MMTTTIEQSGGVRVRVAGRKRDRMEPRPEGRVEICIFDGEITLSVHDARGEDREPIAEVAVDPAMLRAVLAAYEANEVEARFD